VDAACHEAGANETAAPTLDAAQATGEEAAAQAADEGEAAAATGSAEAERVRDDARAKAQETYKLARATLADVRDEVQLVVDDVHRQAMEAAAVLPAAIIPPDDPGEEGESEPQTTTADSIGTNMAVAVLFVAGATAAGFAMVWLVSGGTVAAGGSSASSSSLAAARKYAPGLALFTRFEGAKVLEHPNRMALYDLVARKPGVRLQDLCGDTGLSRTAVTHHLRLLENQHLVVSRRVGRSRHFFENGGRFPREQKEAYAVLQNDRSREIAQAIQARPGIIQKGLCEALGLRPSIVHWHVQRLQDAGLVASDRQGRTVAYYPDTALGRVAD
jgi:DNA-binding transcriptional ArsR family regulator